MPPVLVQLLTCAGAIVEQLCAGWPRECWAAGASWLLRACGEPLLGGKLEVALEALLPELGKPRVALVLDGVQREVVLVEVVHVGRVYAHRNAAERNVLLALDHVEPVRPAVACARVCNFSVETARR